MLKRTFCLIFLIVAAAFPLAAQPAPYPFIKSDCTFDPPATLTVQCGTLTVPEDRSNPIGSQVHIAVAVFKAQAAHPAPDPIFFLDGGPGAATLETWGRSFADSFSEFNQTHDVVLLDYRGAGTSRPTLYCTEVADYITQSLSGKNVDPQSGDYITALTDCHSRLVEEEGIDLRMYRTDIIAQDITDLREALGYQEIDLLGGSYGTRLALTILRDHPAGIRSVLLDGVYPPEVGRSAGSIVNTNRAFEELFTACARAVACNTAFPNLRATFYTTAARLNKTPAMLHVSTSYDQQASDIPLTGDIFINYIFNALYSTWLIPSLPLIINQVANGNYDQMSQVVGGKISEDSTLSLGLFLTIDCSEKPPYDSISDVIAIDKSVPLLGDFYLHNGSSANSGSFDECALWDTGAPTPIDSKPIVSDVPVLIFNGEFDPVTPPNWGELAARTLANSRVITFPGIGHGASLSGSLCAHQLAVAFFADPHAPLPSGCLNATPIRWTTVDLANSLAATEAKFSAVGYWTQDYHQSTIYWNSASWRNSDDAALLTITDYLTVIFPQQVDNNWFDRLFANWGRYKVRDQCQRGSLSLYELTVYSGQTPYDVRYWVDRSSPDAIRDVLLSLPPYSQTSLDASSQKLFPELPTCAT